MKRFFALIFGSFLLLGCSAEPVSNEPVADQPEMADIQFEVPTQPIESPFLVEGEARGTWFFEGVLPVYLEDEQGNVLAYGSATSTESWMTEDFIPFLVTLEFEPGLAEEGTLIFEKENPSGLPENAGMIKVPVEFK